MFFVVIINYRGPFTMYYALMFSYSQYCNPTSFAGYVLYLFMRSNNWRECGVFFKKLGLSILLWTTPTEAWQLSTIQILNYGIIL